MGANLMEVRERIKSVMSTQQSTKAMKLVSAAKLRRAQDAITKICPYSNRLMVILHNILSDRSDASLSAYAGLEDRRKVLVVVVTSSRGLAGAFNTNIIKKATELVEVTYAEQRAEGNVTMLFIGKKGYDFFRKRYTDVPFITEHVTLFSDLTYDNVRPISRDIIDKFLSNIYHEVKVVYGKFKN